MRPIDVDELKKRLEAEHCDCEIMTLIDEIPTIETEPVKHGRWEKHDNLMGEYYHCSVCDTRTEVATCMGDPIFVYCPFCGAKMDKGVSARMKSNEQEEKR